VVAYGSTLRRDDGVGHVVAAEIERLALPGVRVRALTQLVPELVEDLGGADRVVFVDAAVHSDEVQVHALEPAAPGPVSHHADPASLLALAISVGVEPPEAFVVTVPAFDLSVGEGLSEECRMWSDVAVDRVRSLVDR